MALSPDKKVCLVKVTKLLVAELELKLRSFFQGTGSAFLEGHGEEAGSQAKRYFLDFIRILLADVREVVERPLPVLYLLLLQCSVVVNRCQ